MVKSFSCIMISVTRSWYPHLPSYPLKVKKEGLAPSMNILHLSVFTPSQLSALHVPEEKQIKDSFTACFNVEANDGFAA